MRFCSPNYLQTYLQSWLKVFVPRYVMILLHSSFTLSQLSFQHTSSLPHCQPEKQMRVKLLICIYVVAHACPCTCLFLRSAGWFLWLSPLLPCPLRQHNVGTVSDWQWEGETEGQTGRQTDSGVWGLSVTVTDGQIGWRPMRGAEGCDWLLSPGRWRVILGSFLISWMPSDLNTLLVLISSQSALYSPTP